MSSIYIVSEVLFAGMHHWSRGRQPRFKTELGRMSYFFSKDEAEKAIRANASHLMKECRYIVISFVSSPTEKLSMPANIRVNGCMMQMECY